ncbi:MAG: hypothetical protein AAFY60_02645, partial [Myxococcota bacterium]
MRAIPFFAVTAALLTPDGASAQLVDRRNFDANRLRPAMSREGVMNVESPVVPGHLRWDATLWYDYADDPYVVLQDGERIASLLKSRSDLHLIGALSLFELVQIGIDLPFTLDQTRGGRALSLGFSEIEARGLGDIAITPKVQILGGDDAPIELAALGRFTITTASPRDAYLGERISTFTPELAIAKRINDFYLAGNAAFLFRDNLPSRGNDLNIDHELVLRAGASYDFQKVAGRSLKAELSVESFTPLRRPFNKSNTTGAEWLAGLAVEASPQFELFAGGGTALASAYSVPDYRFFAGLRFFERYGDADGDGIEDSDDRCARAAEDKDGFEDTDGCPDLDNDQDGVPDSSDQAPNEPEDKDGYQDEDGAPDPDNDGDGIEDAADQAPLDPEDLDGFEDEDGVPDLDNDGDGIEDSADGAP